MFDVMADFMNFPLLAHRYLGGAPARMGLTHALIAPYGAYRTADGNQVLIAIQSDREWQIFCEIVLEQPDLANDDRFINNTARVSHRFEMDESINSVFGQMSLEALMELLDSARIANGRLSSVEDLSNHEFLKKQIVNYGGTAIELAALPVPIDGDRPLEVPTLNQHGDRIRQEFQS
jgi:formyl-CoA transferase